jgi:beta-xylosidase
MTQTYQNPIHPHNFPDISILQRADGWYAYASQGPTPDGFHNIQRAFSTDLVHWQAGPDALPHKSPQATGQSYWAPAVIEPWPQAQPGVLRLFFNAQVNQAGQGLFVAEGRVGHAFTKIHGPLIYGPLHDYEHIDADPFYDPQSEQWYLIWGSCAQPIKARALNGTLTGFAPNSQTSNILAPQPHRPLGFVYEGATLYTRPHPQSGQLLYYLEYSGEDTFGYQSYAIQVARSSTGPLGPFITKAEATGTLDSAYYRSNDSFLNPGHHCRTSDRAGTVYILAAAFRTAQLADYPRLAQVYLQHRQQLLDQGYTLRQIKQLCHAATLNQPPAPPYQALVQAYLQLQQYLLNSPRIMLLDRVDYDREGWPFTSTGSPSTTPQPLPSV